MNIDFLKDFGRTWGCWFWLWGFVRRVTFIDVPRNAMFLQLGPLEVKRIAHFEAERFALKVMRNVQAKMMPRSAQPPVHTSGSRCGQLQESRQNGEEGQ